MLPNPRSIHCFIPYPSVSFSIPCCTPSTTYFTYCPVFCSSFDPIPGVYKSVRTAHCSSHRGCLARQTNFLLLYLLLRILFHNFLFIFLCILFHVKFSNFSTPYFSKYLASVPAVLLIPIHFSYISGFSCEYFRAVFAE